MTFKRRKTGEEWDAEGAQKPPSLDGPPTKQLHVRLTDRELSELERAAVAFDTSMTRMARRAIRRGLEAMATEEARRAG